MPPCAVVEAAHNSGSNISEGSGAKGVQAQRAETSPRHGGGYRTFVTKVKPIGKTSSPALADLPGVTAHSCVLKDMNKYTKKTKAFQDHMKTMKATPESCPLCGTSFDGRHSREAESLARARSGRPLPCTHAS